MLRLLCLHAYVGVSVCVWPRCVTDNTMVVLCVAVTRGFSVALSGVGRTLSWKYRLKPHKQMEGRRTDNQTDRRMDVLIASQTERRMDVLIAR